MTEQTRDAVVFLNGRGEVEIKPMNQPHRCTEEQFDAVMDHHIDEPAIAVIHSPFFPHVKIDRACAVYYSFVNDKRQLVGFWVNHQGLITNITRQDDAYPGFTETLEDQYGCFFG